MIRPGDLDVAPAGVNPLEPAAGPDGTRFPLQAHADLVRALFLAAFEADEPFPQVLAAALARCYEQAGWDLVTGEPAVPGARTTRRWATCKPPRTPWWRRSGTAGRSPTTCAASSGSGSGRCAWAPPGGSSAAGHRLDFGSAARLECGAGDRGLR